MLDQQPATLEVAAKLQLLSSKHLQLVADAKVVQRGRGTPVVGRAKNECACLFRETSWYFHASLVVSEHFL